MLIGKRWVTWKNVSHQSSFPTIAVESNTSEVYNKASSPFYVSRILVLIAGSPVRTNICFVHKKKRHCPDAFSINTLIKNLFPLSLASIREGNISHSAKSGRTVIPPCHCPALRPARGRECGSRAAERGADGSGAGLPSSAI